MPEPHSMADSQRYPSIDALVDEHSELLKHYLAGQMAVAVPGAKSFVARAARTGSILWRTQERQAAQTRIDYWVTTLLQGFDIAFKDTLLAELNEGELAAARDSVAAAARKVSATLDEPHRKLLSKIIQRVAGVSPRGDFETKQASVSDLTKLGDAGSLIDELKRAGVIRVVHRGNPPEDVAEAMDPEVLKQWPEANAWLQQDRARSEQRQSFRIAAEQWKANPLDKSRLLSGALLEEARAYSDKSELEQEFLASSQAAEISRSNQRNRVLVGFVLLSLIAALTSFLAWRASVHESNRANLLLNLKRQITARNTPDLKPAFVCRGFFTQSGNGFYYYVSLQAAALQGTSSITYRVEFAAPSGAANAVNSEPLILVSTSPKDNEPPPEAVWNGYDRPSNVAALIEYRDLSRDPVIGGCQANINWQIRSSRSPAP